MNYSWPVHSSAFKVFDLGAITDVDHMLKLSPTAFYIISRGPTSDQRGLYRRIDVTTPTVPTTTWSKYMNCPDANNWGVGRSSAVLSSDASVLYTITGIGGAGTFNLGKLSLWL